MITITNEMTHLYAHVRVHLVISAILLLVSCVTPAKQASSPSATEKKASDAALIYEVPGYPFELLSVDLNGDSFEDLVVMSKYKGVFIYFHDGSSLSRDPFILEGFLYHGTSIDTGDFNGDGIPDLAYISESWIQILVNDGTGRSYDGTLLLPGPTFGFFMRVADLNNDGISDIAAVGVKDASVYLNISQGPLSFVTQLVSPKNDSSYFDFAAVRLSFGDTDNNGFTDILVPEFRNGALWLIRNEDGEVFDPVLLLQTEPEDLVKHAAFLRYDEATRSSAVAVVSGTHTPLLRLLSVSGDTTAVTARHSLPYQFPEHITFGQDGWHSLLVTHSRSVEGLQGAVTSVLLDGSVRGVEGSRVISRLPASGAMSSVRKDMGILTLCQKPYGVCLSPP